MQKRHTDREQYFKELAATCKKYYIPFLDKETSIGRGTKVIEIGCGDGGNLLPFLECGCDVTGIEISPTRISQAKSFFEKHSTAGRPELECADIFTGSTEDLLEYEGKKVSRASILALAKLAGLAIAE